MRRTLVALAAALAVLLPGAPAWAHNRLTDASPPADSTLPAAPKAVTLTFLQPLKPEFTTIVVSTAARRRIPAADPEVAGATSSVALTQDLPNGPYTVAYRTVSVDGHVVQGAYTFTVADPAKPAPTTSSAPTAAPPPARGGLGRLLLLGLAGLGVVAIVLAALVLRARRPARRPPPTPDRIT